MTEPLLFPVGGSPRETEPRFTLHQLLNGDVERALAAAEPGPTEPVDVIVFRKCRYCGCTDDRACAGGWWWIADDVCSSCGESARADGIEVGGIRRRVRAALAIRRPDRTVLDAILAADEAGARAGRHAVIDVEEVVSADGREISRTTRTVGRCVRCDGCGQLADDDDESPWSAWENLPTGSDLAVRLGLVSPHPCPDCAGLGVVPT